MPSNDERMREAISMLTAGRTVSIATDGRGRESWAISLETAQGAGGGSSYRDTLRLTEVEASAVYDALGKALHRQGQITEAMADAAAQAMHDFTFGPGDTLTPRALGITRQAWICALTAAEEARRG